MCGRFTAAFEFSDIRVRLLKPLPAELLDAHDVLPIVNSAKYDAGVYSTCCGERYTSHWAVVSVVTTDKVADLINGMASVGAAVISRRKQTEEEAIYGKFCWY